MNATKPKNLYDKYVDLQTENKRLRRLLDLADVALAEALKQVAALMREAVELNTSLDAARKVATAAVAYLAAVDSFGETRSAKEYFDRYNPANEDLRAAIASYRALTEPLSPKTQADLDHALQALREKEESGELEKIAYQQGGNASL